MKMFLVAMSVVVLALLGSPLLAATADFSSGKLVYRLDTGTGSGNCSTIVGGYQCTDGSHDIIVYKLTGCGQKDGYATCIVIDPADPPPVTPLATSTLECEDTNYEVSDGGDGSCSPNDGEAMTCADEGTNNFAQASCEEGCGAVSGEGSCKVK